MLLKDKVILITGASRGIGLEVAKKCLAEGARIAANSRGEAPEIAALVGAYGKGKVLFAKADVSVASDVCRMMELVRSSFLRLDGIVNNAGIITRSPDWKNIPQEDWSTVLNTNLLGVWNVIRFGIELMNNGGSIVNISSIYGAKPEAKALPYSASKAAVIALTQALAKETAPDIRINAVLPGNTLTSMVPDSSEQKQIEKRTLMKRSASAAEIAAAIVFLLSDASSYMTGSILPVDGGYGIR